MSFFTDQNSRLNNAGETWSYTQPSTGVTRFEVRGDDYFASPNAQPGEGDFAQGKNRSEQASFRSMQPGREFTVEFDFQVETGPANTADWLVLAQLHQTEDLDANGNLLDGTASPPVVLGMRGEQLVIINRTSDEKILVTEPVATDLWLDDTPVQRGVWNTFRMEVVFDHETGGDGVLKVWINDTQVVNHAGPMGYNDDVGPYLSVGVYREQADETTAAQFRNVDVAGAGLPDPMEGTSGNDNIEAAKLGFWEAEVLRGFAGDDTLNGGVGADTMEGGAGNDIYVVDNTGDVVSERLAGVDQGGTDQIQSFVSYTMGADIENMILQGTADIDGTGNAKANLLQGNTGANTLMGAAGNDDVLGDLGDDMVDGGAGDDQVYGGGGNDTVMGGAGNDELYGEAGNDSLMGGAGNDTLEGGTGIDTLVGGAGDDEYVISVAGDTAVETAGGGTDTVRAEVNFDAGADSHIEVINTRDQSGTAAINLYGGDIANEMRGNAGDNVLGARGGDDMLFGFGGDDTLSAGAGNDTLDGGTGADSLAGGAGNDVYIVDNAGDRVSEATGQGDDTVRAGANFSAGNAEIEHIFTNDQSGTTAINLSGSFHTNEIRGNAGANLLNGGSAGDDVIFAYAGNDTLLGGAGADNFYGGAGDDSLEGGAGNDTLRGEDGSDTLSGGDGNDALYTGSGAGGMLEGGAGNDTFFVDALDTQIFEAGNGGTDTVRTTVSLTLTADAEVENLQVADQSTTDAIDLTGSNTANTLRGNNGDNLLDGQGGADLLFGNGGDDTYRVDNTGDRVNETAGNGDDLVLTSVNFSLSDSQSIETVLASDMAGDQPISLSGNSSANTIVGSAANNALNGRGGDDLLYSGMGTDTLRGGDGTDTAFFAIASTDVGVVAGGSSIILTLEDGTKTITNDVENFRFADATLTYAQVAALTGQAAQNSDVQGSASDDFLAGSSAANVLRGNAGDDTMTAGRGNDSLYGGTGADTVLFNASIEGLRVSAVTGGLSVTSSEGTDFIANDIEHFFFDDADLSYAELAAYTGSGGPTTEPTTGTPITGTEGAENVAGTDASEVINAGGGSDWITPGAGSDTIDGGAGRDMVSFNTLLDTPGRPVTTYRLTVDMQSGVATTSDGDTYSFTNVERITSTVNEDYLRGSAGNDQIRASGAYDWIVATTGADTLDGGQGSDMVSYLEYSNDSIASGDVFDDGSPLSGAAVTGVVVDLKNNANNTGLAEGHIFIDIERITGSSREDVFWGNEAENDFRGAGGYDWFVGSTGGRERYFGGTGVDTVTYFNATSGIDASLRNGAMVNGEESGRGTRGDAASDLFFEIENLVGTGFADSLTGNAGRNELNGLSGDDMLFGFAGVDRLMGGAGNDTIDGGGGSDFAIFTGDAGDYVLTKTSANTVTVVGADGTDSLIDVEYFRFDDGDVTIWELSL